MRASTSAYSKAVVASAKELHRQGAVIDGLKDDLDAKDAALVRPLLQTSFCFHLLGA